MSIYLIRHTKPLVEKGFCYGQTDLDVCESFSDEVQVIRSVLPEEMKKVYASPLKRCRVLAETLFDQPIEFHHDLKELHCGDWEMQHWDEIPEEQLLPWMDNLVEAPVPGGESYRDLYERSVQRYQAIAAEELPAAIVAHAGVIRSILAHVQGISIRDAFTEIKLHYGAVVKLDPARNAVEILSNIEVKGEQHRPTRWLEYLHRKTQP